MPPPGTCQMARARKNTEREGVPRGLFRPTATFGSVQAPRTVPQVRPARPRCARIQRLRHAHHARAAQLVAEPATMSCQPPMWPTGAAGRKRTVGALRRERTAVAYTHRRWPFARPLPDHATARVSCFHRIGTVAVRYGRRRVRREPPPSPWPGPLQLDRPAEGRGSDDFAAGAHHPGAASQGMHGRGQIDEPGRAEGAGRRRCRGERRWARWPTSYSGAAGTTPVGRSKT